MKKITLFIFLLIMTISHAQIDPMDDFEGNGNITWAADGSTGMDVAFANPSSTGINTSATVLEYNDDGAEQYANINFDLSTDTSVKYDLSTKNVFTLKVFVPTPAVAVTSGKTLALKLQDHSSSSPWEGQQVVSIAYEYDVWTELVFDFSAHSAATNFSRIVVQFNGENNNEAVKAYIDDLSYGAAVVANDCAGTSSDAQQGSFAADYSYGFETLTNGDVRLTFAMPAGTDGLVAYAWKESPFAETGMTVTGTVATLDVAGYATGTEISYAVKFVWAAGGLGVTKYFTYTVGEVCATASVASNSALEVSLYPNPAKNELNIFAKTSIESAVIYNILGKKVKTFTVNAVSKSLDISNLSAGIYILRYTAKNAVGSMKFVKE